MNKQSTPQWCEMLWHVTLLQGLSGIKYIKLWWCRYSPKYSEGWVMERRFRVHDDVIKWKHIPRYWPFVRGMHRSPVNFPHKGQWGRSLMFSLICAWINGWVNNREPGDLKRHRDHCDITMWPKYTPCPTFVIATTLAILRYGCWDQFVNVTIQWETKLHCNVVSHWLGAYKKLSLSRLDVL